MISTKITTTSDWLLERHIITAADIAQAQRLQSEVGGFLGQALLRIGAVSEEDLLKARGSLFEIPIIDASEISHEADDYLRAMTALDLPPRWFKSRECVVWQDTDDAPIKLLARNILDQDIQEQIQQRAYRANIDHSSFLEPSGLRNSHALYSERG